MFVIHSIDVSYNCLSFTHDNPIFIFSYRKFIWCRIFHLSDSWLSYLSFIKSRNLSCFIPSINFYRNRTSQSFYKYILEKDGIELQIFPSFLFENFKGIGILSCFIKNRNILSQLEIPTNLKYFLQCILNKNLEHRDELWNKK